MCQVPAYLAHNVFILGCKVEQNFIENELIILTKQTYDEFLRSDNPVELIALYSFYYYTAKWQKTNQPKCTTGYAAAALKWSEAKVRKYKKELIALGLIEDAAIRDNKNRVSGHYIKLNYLLKSSTASNFHPHDFPQGGIVHRVENLPPNALSDNNINALSTVNKNDDTQQSKKTSISVRVDEVIDAYKTICKSFTQIKVVSLKRKKDIEKSLKTFSVDQIKQCFELAEHNYLLKGLIMQGKDGKDPWKATFDWLIKEENLAKIFNGNYSKYDDRTYTLVPKNPEVDLSKMTFEELEEFENRGGDKHD